MTAKKFARPRKEPPNKYPADAIVRHLEQQAEEQAKRDALILSGPTVRQAVAVMSGDERILFAAMGGACRVSARAMRRVWSER